MAYGKIKLDPEIAQLPLNAAIVESLQNKIRESVRSNGLASRADLAEIIQRRLNTIKFKPGMGGDPNLDYGYLFDTMAQLVREAGRKDPSLNPEKILDSVAISLMFISESDREKRGKKDHSGIAGFSKQ